jgi:hypothetical protein
MSFVKRPVNVDLYGALNSFEIWRNFVSNEEIFDVSRRHLESNGSPRASGIE